MEVKVDKDAETGKTFPIGSDGKRTTWEELRAAYPHVTFRIVQLYPPEPVAEADGG